MKNTPNIKSIIITGGFGKGEGSIKLTKDGKVRCLRDFDIVCIVDRKPNSKAIDELCDKIYKSLDLINPEFLLFRGKSFTIDLKFFRIQDLIYPDIYFYDLKVASQILWGEDVRRLIPWTKNDIPLSSGLRLLFEKVCGLLGHFSTAYVQRKTPNYQEKESLVSECHKTFIEIGTALCILAGKYEPKYAQRAKVLENSYSTQFPELARVLPELPKKVTEYTDVKLNTRASMENYEDPIELWFSARSYLREVLSFYLKRYTGKSLSNWKNLPNLMRTVARVYYNPFLDPLLRARLQFSSRFALAVASLLYQGLTNLEYVYVVALKQRRIHLRPLLSWRISPSLKYFSAGVMLLFSLNRDATIKKSLLKSAADELRNCVPVKISSFDASGWEEVRYHFLQAYSLYRGYHFVK